MALRISRRVCTLGRPGALGAGTKGSMWNHSASDKSVWYALLMLGTLPSHYLRTPFRTVSLGSWVNSGIMEVGKETPSGGAEARRKQTYVRESDEHPVRADHERGGG